MLEFTGHAPLLIGAAALVLLTEACAGHRPPAPSRPPAPRTISFTATAYCQRGITASGVAVRDGMVAADPDVLPLGTVIRVAGAGRYNGVYRVLDTGANIRGRRLDLFIRNCREAIRFGRRDVTVSRVR